MLEIWKDVEGYDGRYMISQLGRVKSLIGSSKILKLSKDRTGYLRVGISKNGVQRKPQLHQLLAVAFLGHEVSGHKLIVDHINNNRLDNRLCNLQVITHRENLTKDRLGRSSKYAGVSWNNSLKKWKAVISINNKSKYLGVFTSEKKAGEAYQMALLE